MDLELLLLTNMQYWCYLKFASNCQQHNQISTAYTKTQPHWLSDPRFYTVVFNFCPAQLMTHSIIPNVLKYPPWSFCSDGTGFLESWLTCGGLISMFAVERDTLMLIHRLVSISQSPSTQSYVVVPECVGVVGCSHTINTWRQLILCYKFIAMLFRQVTIMESVRNRMPVSLRGGGGELGNLKP
jgi:hypothetical protein